MANQNESSQKTSFVTLRDGRKLGYSEFGLPGGKPVLYTHGHPGSRMDIGIIGTEILVQHGLRLIAPDRPGIGISDFLPGRRIIDWPADVVELADSLGIERFSVLSVSCGGPFAAATAYALPYRVKNLVLVSSVGDFNIRGATEGMGPGLMYFRLGRHVPFLSRLMLNMMSSGLNSNREKMVARVKQGLPPPDFEAMEAPGVTEAFLETLAEFLRQGSTGPAWEAGLFMRPWGFPLEEIHVPCHLWHSEADRNAPIAMGRDQARRIPGCVATFIPREGHFSLFKNYAAKIFENLVEVNP